MGMILKGTPLNYGNPKQVVWVRTTAGDFACTAETEINSSQVTVIIQDNGTAHAFCESAPKESYRRIVRNQRGYPRILEEFIKGGVAVLYSVVNAGVRELWVKTATAEVKVGEFVSEITITPVFSEGGVGSVLSTSGSRSMSGDQTDGLDILNGWIFFPYGAGISANFDLFVSATGISGGGSGTVRANTTNAAIASAAAGQTVTDTNSTVFSSELGTLVGRTQPLGLNLSKGVFGSGLPISFSGAGTHTLTSLNSATINTPYDAWIASFSQQIYVIIRYRVDPQELDANGIPQNLYDTIRLVVMNSDGIQSNELYSLSDTLPSQPDNWRNPLITFDDTPTPSGDACVDTLLTAIDNNLESGFDYGISLQQDISGSTLRDRLQTSPGTVAATLTTQTATSGDTCTLGTAAESTVQVPSPGRGTIEGITYLP